MKWIVISGTWRYTNGQVEQDVRSTVREIIQRGDGIITGGAPSVDYFAIDEALKLDPKAQRIKVMLPTSLKFYFRHTKLRMEEGKLARTLGDPVIKQLNNLERINSSALIESHDISGKVHIERGQYFTCNNEEIAAADELIAFLVNNSEGTRDAIAKARKKGIPVKVFTYSI